jgi:hypothetical protein
MLVALGEILTRKMFSDGCVHLIRLREEELGAYVDAVLNYAPGNSGFKLGASRDAVLLVSRNSAPFIATIAELPSPEFRKLLRIVPSISATLPGRFRGLLKEIGRQALQAAEIRALNVDLPKDTGSVRAPSSEIPAADRFVRIGDNNPDAEEAKGYLSDLATQIEQSNTLPLPKEERAVLAAEIRILVGMLEQKVVRLAQVQFAISHDGVLGYVQGNFKNDVRAGLVGSAIALLMRALGMPL